MSPVVTLPSGLWLPRLGYFAKGESWSQKSAALRLPGRLAALVGQTEAATLRVRFPYDAIGLPGEVPFPYDQPHVAPTFYRFKRPIRRPDGAADQVGRPVVCMSDGQTVTYRQSGLAQEPGFEQTVRWGQPALPCQRADSGAATPCPFSVSKKEGAEPPCQFCCELHLLVPFGPDCQRVEMGVYILEVPRSKVAEVLAQLKALRDMQGGHLVGSEVLLHWEPVETSWSDPATGTTKRTLFYAPQFTLLGGGPPERAPQLSTPPDTAPAAGEEPAPTPEPDVMRAALCQRLAEFAQQFERLSHTPGSLKGPQKEAVAQSWVDHGLSLAQLVAVLWNGEKQVTELAAVEAAALARWGQQVTAAEVTALRQLLGADKEPGP